ncbi:MAG: M12 family metallo-peptidase [Planctomycetota bacterium]
MLRSLAAGFCLAIGAAPSMAHPVLIRPAQGPALNAAIAGEQRPHRGVEADAASLEACAPGDVVLIDLGADELLTGRVESVIDVLPGVTTIAGTLVGQDGDFTLSACDGSVGGSVWVGGELRSVLPGPDGHVVAVGEALEGCGTCEGGVCGGHDEGGGAAAAPHQLGVEIAAESAGDPVSAVGIASVDVLVAYTPLALSKLGSVGGVNATVASAIASSNESLANSLIDAEFNLVAIVPTEYEDSGDLEDDLRALTFRDNEAEDVFAYREAYQADLVALITGNLDFGLCGIAWRSPLLESFGYSVTEYNCISGLTFIHELGHNFGARHHAADDFTQSQIASGSTQFLSNFGHRFTGNNGWSYRTVMAYSPGTRIRHFSNPDVSFQGVATGVSGAGVQPSGLHGADNAAHLNSTRTTIENYRTGVPDLTDCDENGQPDSVQFVIDPASDCDGDGVIDVCQGGDCDGNGIVDACEIDADAALDCNQDGELDSCQIASGALDDCDLSGTPDVCDLALEQVFVTGSLPASGTGVVRQAFASEIGVTLVDAEIVVEAIGDYSLSSEYVTVRVNGVEVGRVFDGGGQDCSAAPLVDTLMIPVPVFNAGGGSLVIDFVGSPAVNATLCGAGFTSATVTYTAINPAADSNGDGVLDVCEADPDPVFCEGDTDGDFDVDAADFVAVLVGFGIESGATRVQGDLNNDGDVDAGDFVMMLTLFGRAYDDACQLL